MKLLTQQSILNDNYVFVFSVDPKTISSNDAALFQKHGSQLVNFGATNATTYAPSSVSVYASYNSTTSEGIGSPTDSFNLPDTFVQFPSCFPFQGSFSIDGASVFTTNTEARLIAYRKYIEAQVYAIVIGLRQLADTFTGDFITNI